MKKMSIRDELGFTNMNWKKVLKEIVDFAPNRFGLGKNYEIKEDHELVELLKIKPHEVMLSLLFLKDQDLIEYDKSDYNWINLTSKGFDVALQNQSAARAGRVNRATIFFGLVIAVTAALGLLMGIEDLMQKIIIMSLFIFAVVFGGITIMKFF